MKIAILVPTFSRFSGPDRVVEDEAERLSKTNEVTVFALKGDIRPKNYGLVLLGAPKSSFLERVYRLFFFFDVFKVRKAVNQLNDFDEIISFITANVSDPVFIPFTNCQIALLKYKEGL